MLRCALHLLILDNCLQSFERQNNIALSDSIGYDSFGNTPGLSVVYVRYRAAGGPQYQRSGNRKLGAAPGICSTIAADQILGRDLNHKQSR